MRQLNCVKRLSFTVAAAVAACASLSCGGPTSPSSTAASDQTYLREVIGAFEQRAYRRATIDWTGIRQQVLAAVDGGMQRLPAIMLTIKLVNDNHSYYIAKNSSAINFPFYTPECQDNRSPMTPFDWPSDVGYVAVGAFSGSMASATYFATQIQDVIRQSDKPNMAGWVVDLRGNTGGNYGPMIAGVGPILGGGVAGYFRRADGSGFGWGYADGGLGDGGPTPTVKYLSNPYSLIEPARRVAVLTDSLTNSSGEATAVAFRGRPATRTFGGETCGRSSAIGGYALSDGGSLGILEMVDVDRLGNVYGGKMPPDETIRDDKQMYARVIQWLRAGQ